MRLSILPQFLDGTRDFVRHFDSDHPREHRNLQIAKPVFQMARLYQRRLNKMELLPLGPRHIDRNEAYLVVSADNLQTCLLAHGEDWMLRRSDLLAIHAQKNISRLDSCVGCRAARVNILKYPSLSERRLVGKVSRAQFSALEAPTI